MILNRALVREVLITGGAVTLIMLCIFLVVGVVGLLRQAAGGNIPIDSVLLLLMLKLFTNMDLIFSLALYVSILMVLGRWNRDNEMTVVAACGIGLSQFLKPMFLLLLIVGLISGTFSLYLSPLSVRKTESIKDEFRNRNEIVGVVPGVFNETRNGRGVYFVENFDKESEQYDRVFAYSSEDGEEGVVVAAKAFQSVDARTNDQFLVLKDGNRYEGVPGSPEYKVIDFETYAIRIVQRAHTAKALPLKGYPTRHLWGTDDRLRASELQWRWSKVVAIPILMLFALALSSIDTRRNRTPALIWAFIAYFSYVNLVGFAIALARKGSIDPLLGTLPLHLAYLSTGCYLLWSRTKNRALIKIPRLRRNRAVAT